MGIFWGDEATDNRGWEDLTADERVYLEVQYLYNVKGRDILDYLDLGGGFVGTPRHLPRECPPHYRERWFGATLSR